MKQVRIKLQSADGTDHSFEVLNMSYEDDVEKDNLLQIDLRPKNSLQQMTDLGFKIGEVVTFYFGYDNILSPTRSAKITDIAPRYAKQIFITLKCLDIGNVMKKTSVQRVWTKQKASDIAIEIASKYKLKADIDPSAKLWDSIPQANRSDFDFLKYLALHEDPGNWMFYVDTNTLHFIKRPLAQNAVWLFAWGNSDIKRFEPNMKQSAQTGGSIRTEVIGWDPLNKEPITGISEKALESTGNFDFNGTESGIDNSFITPGSEHSVEELNAKARNQYENDNLSVMECLLVIDGNARILSNQIFTMNGVASEHQGNWLIKRVSHRLKSGSFETHINATKNATKKPIKDTSEETDNPNKTVGKPDAMSKKTIKSQ